MDKIKTIFNGREEDESGIISDISDATTLSWATRIKGFAICLAAGIICSLLGSVFLFVPNAGLKLFAVFYTLGNILALSSTCFLMGPLNQLKRMFAETRFIATIFVILFLVLTLCSAIWWNNKVLAIVFCFLQFTAMTWYGLTYVPFARDAVKGCISTCLA